jgi:hypothetical protein
MEQGRNRLVAGSALALLLFVAFAWWRGGRTEGRTGQSLAPIAEAPSEPESKLDDPDARALDPGAPTEPRAELTQVESTVREPRPANKTAQPPAEIRGRLLRDDGTPAAGVPVKVHGWGANQDRERLHGVPEDWQDPEAKTGADGRFSIRFDPPRAFQFTLDAKARGCAEASWRWGEIEPGALVDLGEVVLVASGTLEGRIVDGAGQPLLGQEWSIEAVTRDDLAADGRDETRVTARVDPATGRYRVEGVMPGSIELSARLELTVGELRVPVRLEPGQTLTVDLVYGGTDLARRIALHTFSRPLWLLGHPDPRHVKLRGPDGTVREASLMGARISSSFVFDDLEEGEYTLTIDDPRCLPWTSQPLKPGQSLDARMEGSSALALSVLVDGRSQDDFIVDVEYRDHGQPRTIVEHERGLVSGLFAGDLTVRVAAAGLEGVIEVDELLPGETRALELRLADTCVLSGRVVHGDASPAAGVKVSLLQPAQADDSLSSPVMPRGGSSSEGEDRYRKELQQVLSDESGRFRFALAQPGAYAVCATRDGTRVSSDTLVLAGRGRTDLELVLPRGGRVRGRLRALGDVAWEGVRVGFELDRQVDPFLSMGLDRSPSPVAADGRFELAAPVGEVALVLSLADIRTGRFFGGPGSSRQELATVTLAEGEVLERDFEVPSPPGTLVLGVTRNGAAAPGLRLRLEDSHGQSILGQTDAAGIFGPRTAFAGTWTLRVGDERGEWSHAWPEPIEIAPCVETRILALELATARIFLFDRETGAPHAHRRVGLFADQRRIGQLLLTEADGGLSLTLPPGDYQFVLDPGETLFPPAEARRTDTLTWGARGPGVERLSL